MNNLIEFEYTFLHPINIILLIIAERTLNNKILNINTFKYYSTINYRHLLIRETKFGCKGNTKKRIFLKFFVKLFKNIWTNRKRK